MPEGDLRDIEFDEPAESAAKQLERERSLTARFLRLLGSSGDLRVLMREVTLLLRDWSGCDAVGMRMRDGDDFPYFEAHGFPPEFILAENSLCTRDLQGQIARDLEGNALLDCMCGNILCRRFDPALPFFSAGGSFWTNCTTELLATTTAEQRQARTRNRCNGEGYESVALIPLRSGEVALGLIQLNDRRPGRFTPDLIALLEGLAIALAESLLRRRATEALAQSEKHFKALYEQAPLGYQSLDAEGRLIEVNQAWLDLLGYAREEVIGRWFGDFVTPEYRPLFRERFPRFKETGEVHGARFEMVRKDGSILIAQFDGRIARDERGRFLRTHCIWHDVTDRTESERLLLIERDLASALSAARRVEEVTQRCLAAALEATGFHGGGVYLLDPESGELRLECHAGLSDRFAQAVVQFAPDSLQTRVVALGQMIEIDDSDPLMQIDAVREEGLRTVAAAPVLHEGRAIASLNLGSRMPCRLSPFTRHAVEAIASQLGVTLARVRSEADLARSREELRLQAMVLDQIADCVTVTDLEGRITYVNDAQCRVLQRSREALIGHSVNILGNDPDQGATQAEIIERTHHDGGWRGLVVNSTRDGGQVLIDCRTQLVRDASGRAIAMCGVGTDVTEQRRAEQALRESEGRFRGLFDHAIIGAALHETVVDCHGKAVDYIFLEVNPAFEVHTGLSAAQVVGRRATEVFPADAVADLIAIYGRVALTGESAVFETRFPALNRHYSISAYQVAFGRFAALFDDITERKRAEEALRESALRQEMAVRAGNVGLWDWDLATNRVSYSAEWKRQIGYEEHEISDSFEEWQSRVHPDDLAPVLAEIQRYVTAKTPQYRVEFRFRHKDGTYRWIMARASTIADAAGRPVRVLGSHLDITQHKQVELALRDSETLLNRAEEIAGIGSFVWDLPTDCWQWSKGLYSLCGFSPEAVDARRREALARAVHPEDRQRVRREVEGMIAAKRTWPLEVRIVRPDGVQRIVQSDGEFVLDDQGTPVRCVGILLDITDRRADENRLAAMQMQLNHVLRLATLGELAAGIAHELNQPLCAIVNFAKASRNLASREPAELGQIREWCDAIASSAGRAGDIVRRLLHFGRRHESRRETASVGQLIDDALLLVRHEAQTQRVTIRIDMPDGDLAARAHPARIQQVLVNLLRNSLEAMEAAPDRDQPIDVRAVRIADEVRISVSDRGVGLSEADRQRMFEPFFTTKTQGLGLGLAISRTIVEEHHGRIWAEANPEGGLTVCFTLPAEKDGADAVP